MGIKKAFILIFLILAICSVSIGCVYLVVHIDNMIHYSRQNFVAILVIIAGAVCIISALINSIMETIKK